MTDQRLLSPLTPGQTAHCLSISNESASVFELFPWLFDDAELQEPAATGLSSQTSNNCFQEPPESVRRIPNPTPPPENVDAPGTRGSERFHAAGTTEVARSTTGQEQIVKPSQIPYRRPRRRPRSPDPQDDIRARYANAPPCFQISLSGVHDAEGCSGQRPRKVRKAFDDEARKKVGNVRRLKACLRCHLQKVSCDGNTPCGRCVAVHGKARIYQEVCVRLKLEEADCFRIGNSKFRQERAQIINDLIWLEASDRRIMNLIRPRALGHRWPQAEYYPQLQVTVREFVPRPTDITAERWRSGSREQVLELPCLACDDLAETSRALMDWMDGNFKYYCRDMTDQEGDYLIGATFAEALRYVEIHPTSIVKQALRIWIGSRMAQEFFSVREDNPFNIGVVRDANSIHDRQCPVPPVLDHQLDTLMIYEMIKMQREILRKMRRMIEDRKRDTWYEVFLTTFVLLTNLRYVHQAQQRWWKMHFNTGVKNEIGEAYRSASYRFMQRYEHSANNLLTHFRCALKGPVPFSLDWDKEDVARLGGMDPASVRYVMYVSDNVQRRMDEFRNLARAAETGVYEGAMVWTCQLFIDPAT